MEVTPLEKLDEAIREFAREVEDDGLVSGWVLGYQLSTIVDEPGVLPLRTRTTYSLSPSTTTETALGIHSILGIHLDRAVHDDLDEEDEDGEQ